MEDSTWTTKRQKIIKLLEKFGLLDLQTLMVELEYESKYSLIEDIQSIAKSVRNEGKVILVEPPRCYACGYEFEIHEGKMKIPSKCPECKEQRISWPRIKLAPK